MIVAGASVEWMAGGMVRSEYVEVVVSINGVPEEGSGEYVSMRRMVVDISQRMLIIGMELTVYEDKLLVFNGYIRGGVISVDNIIGHLRSRYDTGGNVDVIVTKVGDRDGRLIRGEDSVCLIKNC